MMPDWSPLRQELAAWRRDGLTLPLWWRDDDAVDQTPALDRLLGQSKDLNLPLHLAIIPAYASTTLAQRIEETDAVALVHGWAHENHAAPGAKKAEFGHPRADAQGEARSALSQMRRLFGPQLLEMFVPPWNRIDPGIAAQLAALGYEAISTFTPRAHRQVNRLAQINTHIDPIHWRGGGGLVPPEETIGHLVGILAARRQGDTDASEPLGLLTHHLVHDDNVWNFTRACLTELLDGGANPTNLLTLKETLP